MPHNTINLQLLETYKFHGQFWRYSAGGIDKIPAVFIPPAVKIPPAGGMAGGMNEKIMIFGGRYYTARRRAVPPTTMVSMHFKVVVSGEKVGKIISFAFKVRGIEIKETPA